VEKITIAHLVVNQWYRFTLVPVSNFSDRLIRLEADLPVAEHHLVSSEDGRVVPMEPDQDSASASSPSCSVIDRPGLKREQPKKVEMWRSDLQRNLIGLSKDQTEQFLSLVTEYEDNFSKDTSDLGKSHLLEHPINAGDCKPVKQRPR